jgi:hypothetical protein
LQFDADNARIGWAESTCDYSQLLSDNGYLDVLQGTEMEISPDSAASQQQQQEHEQEQTEEEEQNEAVEDNMLAVDDDDGVVDEESSSSNEKKIKPSSGDETTHEGESPSNDMQSMFANNCTALVCGGGLIVTLLFSVLLCFACYRWCCAPQAKRPVVAYGEVELSPGSSYKDSFVDDDDDDDDDAEYGVVKTSYKDV